MANLQSAKKRIKQNDRSRVRNRSRRSVIKTETRRLLEAIHDGDVQLARSLFSQVTKTLDQTAAKGTLHRNAVARQKSRLAKRVNAAVAAKAAA